MMMRMVFCFLLMTLLCTVTPASANKKERFASGGNSPAKNQYMWAKAHPEGAGYLDVSFPNGSIRYGSNGEVAPKSRPYVVWNSKWPYDAPPLVQKLTDDNTFVAIDQVTEASGTKDPLIGRNLLNGNVAAISMAVASQQALVRAQKPESIIPLAREAQNQQNIMGADNAAHIERSQAACAIDFVKGYLDNFTVDSSNAWNKIRDQLFMPMALLLLLPGALLAQLKATVNSGFRVFGDEINPFDGILRSVVAIFLIPGTYLVVNYSIDVSNSISYTIRQEYQRIFSSDLYEDALAAHVRAMPVRQVAESRQNISNEDSSYGVPQTGSTTAFARMEAKGPACKIFDPKANIYSCSKEYDYNVAPYGSSALRSQFANVNAVLTTTWTLLCAFQMAYLRYLWFVGPIVAALWVYPMAQLRQALPSWIEAVVTLCFWSLFWNICILLMACFRGVDETGTVMITALNTLTTLCVKFGFDFGGLVEAIGQEAAKMAEKAVNPPKKPSTGGGIFGGIAKVATGFALGGPAGAIAGGISAATGGNGVLGTISGTVQSVASGGTITSSIESTISGAVARVENQIASTVVAHVPPPLTTAQNVLSSQMTSEILSATHALQREVPLVSQMMQQFEVVNKPHAGEIIDAIRTSEMNSIDKASQFIQQYSNPSTVIGFANHANQIAQIAEMINANQSHQGNPSHFVSEIIQTAGRKLSYESSQWTHQVHDSHQANVQQGSQMSLANVSNQTNQTNVSNVSNQSNQTNQTIQMAQMNQASEMNQMIRVDHSSPIDNASLVNQVIQVTEAAQIHQSAQIHQATTQIIQSSQTVAGVVQTLQALSKANLVQSLIPIIEADADAQPSAPVIEPMSTIQAKSNDPRAELVNRHIN